MTDANRVVTVPKVGLVLPTLTGFAPGVTLGWPEHLALARAAEAAGFDSVWVPDELLYEHDDAEPTGWWECWTFLAAIAAEVERVDVGTFVTCTNYRNPSLIAKMAASVDEISGGRLVLGLGAGWSERQFKDFGFPTNHIFDRFEDAVAVIHRLLREGHASFQGRFIAVPQARLLPAGPRPGGIPMMIGGTGRRTISVAARYADAWNAFLIGGECTPKRLVEPMEALDAACQAIGREPGAIARTAGIMLGLDDRPFRVGTADWAAGAIRGAPREIADQLLGFAEIGISHLQVGITPTVPSAVEASGTILEMMRESAPSST